MSPRGQSKDNRKLRLQLIPKSSEPWCAEKLKDAGFNPFLQLTFKAYKPISFIVNHLHEKWGKVLRARNGKKLEVRLYPPEGSMDEHTKNGWCEDDDITGGDILQQMNKPNPFRLEYSWRPEREEDDEKDGLPLGYKERSNSTFTMYPPSANPNSRSNFPPKDRSTIGDILNVNSTTPFAFDSRTGFPDDASTDNFASSFWSQNSRDGSYSNQLGDLLQSPSRKNMKRLLHDTDDEEPERKLRRYT